MKLAARIGILEQRAGNEDERQAQIQEDASLVVARLSGLADRFDDTARSIDPATMATWAPAKRVAWAMRFAPGQAPAMILEHLA